MKTGYDPNGPSVHERTKSTDGDDKRLFVVQTIHKPLLGRPSYSSSRDRSAWGYMTLESRVLDWKESQTWLGRAEAEVYVWMVWRSAMEGMSLEGRCIQDDTVLQQHYICVRPATYYSKLHSDTWQVPLCR